MATASPDHWSLALTALEWFRFDDTELCAPPDHTLQAWLHGIKDVRGADCVPVAMEQHDRAALIALYEATGGPNWKKSENWLSDAPLSDWHGVTTDRNGRVMELMLWTTTYEGPSRRLSNLKFVCLDGN